MHMSTVKSNESAVRINGSNNENIYESPIQRNSKDDKTQWKRVVLALVVISVLLIGVYGAVFGVVFNKFDTTLEESNEFQNQLSGTKNKLFQIQAQLNDSKQVYDKTVEELQEQINAESNEFQNQLSGTKNKLFQIQTQLNDSKQEYDKTVEKLQEQINAGITESDFCNVKISGVYYVTTNRLSKLVYCEVDSDGTSWLVFQRRIDGSVNFYRNWTDYQEGFGSLKGNFWLGLEALHAITSSGSYQLRVDIEDWEDNTAYALYSFFSIGNEASSYILRISGYSGTAGDSLTSHNNQPFTTYDRDNDAANTTNCAISWHGAWWYEACHDSNLNGEYLRNQVTGRAMSWYYWKSSTYALKSSKMKIRLN